jgi:hypothetical protein
MKGGRAIYTYEWLQKERKERIALMPDEDDFLAVKENIQGIADSI